MTLMPKTRQNWFRGAVLSLALAIAPIAVQALEPADILLLIRSDIADTVIVNMVRANPLPRLLTTSEVMMLSNSGASPELLEFLTSPEASVPGASIPYPDLTGELAGGIVSEAFCDSCPEGVECYDANGYLCGSNQTTIVQSPSVYIDSSTYVEASPPVVTYSVPEYYYDDSFSSSGYYYQAPYYGDYTFYYDRTGPSYRPGSRDYRDNHRPPPPPARRPDRPHDRDGKPGPGGPGGPGGARPDRDGKPGDRPGNRHGDRPGDGRRDGGVGGSTPPSGRINTSPPAPKVESRPRSLPTAPAPQPPTVAPQPPKPRVEPRSSAPVGQPTARPVQPTVRPSPSRNRQSSPAVVQPAAPRSGAGPVQRDHQRAPGGPSRKDNGKAPPADKKRAAPSDSPLEKTRRR